MKFCLWCAIFVTCFLILTTVPNFPVNAQSVLPDVTIGLDEPARTANVAPGESGLVEFNLTVTVDKPMGTTLVVELVAEDTWNSAVVSPTSLQFQSNGVQTAKVIARAPPRTSATEVGNVRVTGTWTMTPSGLTGQAEPTDGVVGRIDIAQYYSFSLYSKTSEKEGTPDSEVVYELIIRNDGNGRDTFSFNVQNINDLKAKDFKVKLSQVQADIEEYENFSLKIVVKVPGGMGNIGEHDVKLEVSSVAGELRGATAQTFTFKLIVPSSAMIFTGEFYAILIVIIVIIVGLFWYRRRKKKKLND